jgi:hypothetical protein
MRRTRAGRNVGHAHRPTPSPDANHSSTAHNGQHSFFHTCERTRLPVPKSRLSWMCAAHARQAALPSHTGLSQPPYLSLSAQYIIISYSYMRCPLLPRFCGFGCAVARAMDTVSTGWEGTTRYLPCGWRVR